MYQAHFTTLIMTCDVELAELLPRCITLHSRLRLKSCTMTRKMPRMYWSITLTSHMNYNHCCGEVERLVLRCVVGLTLALTVNDCECCNTTVIPLRHSCSAVTLKPKWHKVIVLHWVSLPVHFEGPSVLSFSRRC